MSSERGRTNGFFWLSNILFHAVYLSLVLGYFSDCGCWESWTLQYHEHAAHQSTTLFLLPVPVLALFVLEFRLLLLLLLLLLLSLLLLLLLFTAEMRCS